jgi:hypothetical protein
VSTARGDTGYTFGAMAILVRLPSDGPQVYRSARSVPVDAGRWVDHPHSPTNPWGLQREANDRHWLRSQYSVCGRDCSNWPVLRIAVIAGPCQPGDWQADTASGTGRQWQLLPAHPTGTGSTGL